MNWRLLDTGFNDPYMNMAIDEALLLSMQPDSQPVLRFYDWDRPAISIGYSQKVRHVLNTELCERDGIAVVRRATGGGVVFHGVDITYSVIYPKKLVKDVHSTYMTLQGNLISALATLGLEATQHPNKESLAGHCFVAPNIGDVMIEGKKLSGMAAKRIKHKILFQSYIYYENADKYTKYVKDKAVIKDLNKKAVYAKLLYPKEKSIFKKEIIDNWPGNKRVDSLTNNEEILADKLNEPKYATQEWIYRR